MNETVDKHFFCIFKECEDNIDMLNDEKKIDKVVKTIFDVSKTGKIHDVSIKLKDGIRYSGVCESFSINIRTYFDKKGVAVEIYCDEGTAPYKVMNALRKIFEPKICQEQYYEFKDTFNDSCKK